MAGFFPLLWPAGAASRAAEPAKDADKEQTLDLPAATVLGEAATPVTQGSHSYTTAQTSAATGLPLSLRDTPQSVTVVTQQRMQDQQLDSVSAALREATGLSAYSQDGEGGRVSFYSRGLEVTNFAYDGMPSAELPNTYVPGDGIQDSAFYDRIEVVRGATGLMSGSGNPSASINLVRKRPTREFSASASVTAGSWDNYREMLDLSTPLSTDGRVRGRVVGTYQDADSFMDHYHLRRKSFYGILDADLDDDTRVSLGYQYADADPTGMPWGGQPLYFSNGARTDWSRSTNQAAKWNTWQSTTRTTFLDLEHRFGHDWTLRGEVSQKNSQADARFMSGLGYPDQATGTGLLPVATAGKVDSTQRSFSLMASGPFDWLGREHEAVIGSMASRRTAHDYETGFIYPSASMGSLYTWNGNYPEPDFDSAAYALTRTEVKQTGVYGALRLSLADPLKLIVGGRLSNYEIDQDSASSTFHASKSGKWVPYVGLVYDLDDSYSLYASHTAIFNPQTNRDRNGNVLAPSQGKNDEVGLKAAYLDGRLNASLALFETRLDNVAQTDSGHLLADGTQAYYAANGTRSRGFDLDIQGALAEGWNLSLGLSHFTASEGHGGRLSSEIPRTTAKLFSTYRLPGAWNRLTLGGGLDWQSRFYQAATGPNGAVEVGQGSYALASLMGRYDLTRNTSVQLNVNNLFDRHYSVMTGFYNQELYGAPRNMAVSVSYRL
ncbi:MAG: FhuE receptor [Pseudomonas citronellolis]|nr:MAG: FhuE receptor [Pseudomonas citronellolis]